MQAVLPQRSRLAELITELQLHQVVAGVAFAILFWKPISTTAIDWWSVPDAGHGLLLFPIAMYVGWKQGIVSRPRPAVAVGFTIVMVAVALRYLSGLAAESYTMRWSVLAAVAGLIVMKWGVVQLRRWWLPGVLIALAVPVPALILNTIAFPLQLKASELGAALLTWRHVPVLLDGNVIHLPGRSLFVTEACSGLRSLTALVSLGVLIGGLWLRTIPARIGIILAAIPVAVLLNGFRVFLTGFLVFFVRPELGEGFLHLTEGWLIFVLAFGFLGITARLLIGVETWYAQQLERRA